jgi:hypothetical protein
VLVTASIDAVVGGLEVDVEIQIRG